MTDEDDYFQLRDEQLRRRLSREHGLSRRDLLRLGASGSLLLAAGSSGLVARAGAQAPPAPSPIVKPLPPEWFIPLGTNAEMRWEAMHGQGYTTPNERFFVRNHTSTPLIDPATWRLRVFGSGLRDQRAIELGLRELRRLPSRSRHRVRRVRRQRPQLLRQPAGHAGRGHRSGSSARSASRAGAACRCARCSSAPGSRAARSTSCRQGLDAPVVAGGADQGHVRRPLPIEKALDDALLAYEMNGEPLPPDHGSPLRLVVPGWVGIASIKWLGQHRGRRPAALLALEHDAVPHGRAGLPGRLAAARPPSRSRAPSSCPSARTLPAGRAATCCTAARGRATRRSGASRCSIDGRARALATGAPARPEPAARLGALGGRAGRRRAPGGYELLRARDRRAPARRSPTTVPFNTGGYQFWAVVRHPVSVTAGVRATHEAGGHAGSAQPLSYRPSRLMTATIAPIDPPVSRTLPSLGVCVLRYASWGAAGL